MIEAVREELRDAYRALVHSGEPSTKQQIVRAVAVRGGRTTERTSRRGDRRARHVWLSDLTESLDALVHDEIASRSDRLRQITRPD